LVPGTKSFLNFRNLYLAKNATNDILKRSTTRSWYF
jgi:hypothetical protein